MKSVKNGILNLIGKSFWEEVSEKNTLVMFYLENCGFCRVFQFDYEKIGEESGGIKVARFDYGKNEAYGLEKVEEFPSIALFTNGKPIFYKGKLDKDSILEFVQENSIKDTNRIEL